MTTSEMLVCRVARILRKYVNGVNGTASAYKMGDMKWFRLAFIHKSKSAASHTNNERLEFLGDSVINLVVAHSLYHMFPVADEDVLTRHRSKMVNGTTLATLGEKVGLMEMAIIEERAINASAVEDFFEAFVGALYLTFGHDAAYVFVQNVFRQHYDWSHLDKWDVCMYKRKINSAMKAINTKPVFVRVTQPCPTSPTITMCVKDATGKVWGVGKGATRKDAELKAMQRAWEKLSLFDSKKLEKTKP